MIEWPTIQSIRDDYLPIVSLLCGGKASRIVVRLISDFKCGYWPLFEDGIAGDEVQAMVKIFFVMLKMTESDTRVINYYPMLHFLHKRKLSTIEADDTTLGSCARWVLKRYFCCNFRQGLFKTVGDLKKIPVTLMFAEKTWVVNACPLATSYHSSLAHGPEWEADKKVNVRWVNDHFRIDIIGASGDFDLVPVGVARNDIYNILCSVTIAGPLTRLSMIIRFNYIPNAAFSRVLSNLGPWTEERRHFIMEALEKRPKDFDTPSINEFLSHSLPFDGHSIWLSLLLAAHEFFRTYHIYQALEAGAEALIRPMSDTLTGNDISAAVLRCQMPVVCMKRAI